jgi:hypothetical protein
MEDLVMISTSGYHPVNKGLRRWVIPVIILFSIFLCIIPAAGAGSTVTDGNSVSGLTASSEQIQFQRAQAAATVLNDRWKENWGDKNVYMWVRANMIESLLNYQYLENSGSYGSKVPPIKERVNDQKNYWRWVRGQIDDSSSDYDDRLWWAVLWIRYYEVTGDREYLSMADDIFRNLVINAPERGAIKMDGRCAAVWPRSCCSINPPWDDACGGGVWYEFIIRNYKSAITNDLFLETATKMAKYSTNDADKTYYRGWADKEANWIRQYKPFDNLTDTPSSVRDGILRDGTKSNDVWSYNQGMYMVAMTDYAELSGETWPNELALSHWNGYYKTLNADHIIREERRNTSCPDFDMHSFKGILVRDLAYSYKNMAAYNPEAGAQIRELLLATSDSAWNNDRTKTLRECKDSEFWKPIDSFGYYWEGPPCRCGLYSSDQAAAVDLFAAAAIVEHEHSIRPPGITNLHNTTYLENSVTWTWNDPGSEIFGSVRVFVNGVSKATVPRGVQSYTISGLKPSVSYTIGTQTVGTDGTTNATWVNQTAVTAPYTLKIDRITPSEGMTDDRMTITISGVGFKRGAIVSFTNGTEQLHLFAPTQVQVNEIKRQLINRNKAGIYDVTITNPDGRSCFLPHGFTLRWSPLHISKISPDNAKNGTTITVSIIGDDFSPGASVFLSRNDVKIPLSDLKITPPNRISGSLTISSQVPIGVYNLTVINPDGQSGMGKFRVS